MDVTSLGNAVTLQAIGTIRVSNNHRIAGATDVLLDARDDLFLATGVQIASDTGDVDLLSDRTLSSSADTVVSAVAGDVTVVADKDLLAPTIVANNVTVQVNDSETFSSHLFATTEITATEGFVLIQGPTDVRLTNTIRALHQVDVSMGGTINQTAGASIVAPTVTLNALFVIGDQGAVQVDTTSLSVSAGSKVEQVSATLQGVADSISVDAATPMQVIFNGVVIFPKDPNEPPPPPSPTPVDNPPTPTPVDNPPPVVDNPPDPIDVPFEIFADLVAGEPLLRAGSIDAMLQQPDGSLGSLIEASQPEYVDILNGDWSDPATSLEGAPTTRNFLLDTAPMPTPPDDTLLFEEL